MKISEIDQVIKSLTVDTIDLFQVFDDYKHVEVIYNKKVVKIKKENNGNKILDKFKNFESDILSGYMVGKLSIIRQTNKQRSKRHNNLLNFFKKQCLTKCTIPYFTDVGCITIESGGVTIDVRNGYGDCADKSIIYLEIPVGTEICDDLFYSQKFKTLSNVNILGLDFKESNIFTPGKYYFQGLDGDIYIIKENEKKNE